jgi:hypothetical protein
MLFGHREEAVTGEFMRGPSRSQAVARNQMNRVSFQALGAIAIPRAGEFIRGHARPIPRFVFSVHVALRLPPPKTLQFPTTSNVPCPLRCLKPIIEILKKGLLRVCYPLLGFYSTSHIR